VTVPFDTDKERTS